MMGRSECLAARRTIHPVDSIERGRKLLIKNLPVILSRYPHRTIEQGYLPQATKASEALKFASVEARYYLPT